MSDIREQFEPYFQKEKLDMFGVAALGGLAFCNRDHIRKALAFYERFQEALPVLKDIEDAPKDKTVLIYNKKYPNLYKAKLTFVQTDETIGGWLWVCEDTSAFEDGEIWEELGYIMPTHWMPLPDDTDTISKLIKEVG